MEPFQQTERTRVRRVPQRATYDRDTVYSILDSALIAHVGFSDAEQPYVLPMAFVRVGDSVFLHGSTKARMLKSIADGAPVCITVTLVDGLVLARSAFHHSMNYRSVAILGRGRAVASESEALAALRALTERLTPGRWGAVRQPNATELKATLVVEVPLEEVSAKVRTGPPLDDEEDLDFDVWAGTVPMTHAYGAPIADPSLKDGIPLPDHVRQLTAATSAR